MVKWIDLKGTAQASMTAGFSWRQDRGMSSYRSAHAISNAHGYFTPTCLAHALRSGTARGPFAGFVGRVGNSHYAPDMRWPKAAINRTHSKRWRDLRTVADIFAERVECARFIAALGGIRNILHNHKYHPEPLKQYGNGSLSTEAPKTRTWEKGDFLCALCDSV